MLLSFKPQFVPLIMGGKKIHTIREDSKRRWKIGMDIHFATGVRTRAFNQFHLGDCYALQEIEMKWVKVANRDELAVMVDGKLLDREAKEILARNDGFSSFKNFCLWPVWKERNFKGIIIHWTTFKY